MDGVQTPLPKPVASTRGWILHLQEERLFMRQATVKLSEQTTVRLAMENTYV